MKRSATLVLGVCCFLLAVLAAGTGRVRAEEKNKDEERSRKVITERIDIGGAGSGGYLGVGLEDPAGAVRGAKVQTVQPDSAAEKAGLEDGDPVVVVPGVSGEDDGCNCKVTVGSSPPRPPGRRELISSPATSTRPKLPGWSELWSTWPRTGRERRWTCSSAARQP